MMIKKISTPIYNINEEGLFASRDYADGRLIPSIVISSKEDDYIKEIIKLHSNISMGDVEVQWVSLSIFTSVSKIYQTICFSVIFLFLSNC
jgi:hypothetical protein